MAGTQSRYEWQFKQRLTSGGLNAQTNYLARNTSELGRALTGSDQEIAGQTGILKGFIATVVPATMRVSISPGLGQFFDGTIGDPDSKAQWMELRASIEVTLSVGNAANPRWDVIEVQPASVNGTAEVIDFFNPADNTFTQAVVSVLKVSTAAAQVRTGAAAVHPKLLAGVAGWIPIAYVYVPANAVALDEDQVLYCRPILSARSGSTPDNGVGVDSIFGEARSISGGGIRVDASGLASFLQTQMSGAFPSGSRFWVPSNAPLQLAAVGNYEGGGLPVADKVVHGYVAPPPYPAGYAASMAPRELYIVDSTVPDLAATIPDDARGCIVVFSDAAPFHTPLGQPGGPADTSTFTDNFWGAISIARSNMIYMGAAFYELAIAGLMVQRVSGFTVATSRKPGKSFLADLPIVAPGETYSLWTEPTGQVTHVRWPTTATDIDMQVRARVKAGDNLKIHITDEHGDESLTQGTYANMYANNDAAEQMFGDMHAVTVSEFGTVKIYTASSTGIGVVADLYAKCYRDAVLRLR